MSIRVVCECGRTLRARDTFAGTRANCPTCGRMIQIPDKNAEAPEMVVETPSASAPLEPEPMWVKEFLDPPSAPETSPKPEGPPVWRRMFEALLDPRSIQWMLTLGGGLLILGLIILLVHWLDVEAAVVIAGSMGAGTLAVLSGGWWLTLRTKYKTAGRALTFLACVVAPLNLWYYHAQGLITLENHLWIGGVVCCLLYAATVRVLRDPLFVYAVEAGVTLTVLLFLPVANVTVDAAALSVSLIVLGLISIHAERAFPDEGSEFTRNRYGLPLFWSGQIQLAISLLILLGSQTLTWLNDPISKFFGRGFEGNLLTAHPLLAATLWLVAVYGYLYSDLVVRRVGVYVYGAAFSILMAVVTVVGWQFESAEAVIVALAVVALGANLLQTRVAQSSEKVVRFAAPPGMILSGIPLLIGWTLHIRATSDVWGQGVSIGWPYVWAMLVVAVGSRISAWLYRKVSIRRVAYYLFLSAAALLLAAAGLLPLIGVESWYQQAPLLMLIPIGYIIASRLWRGHSPERPLGWVAHTATAIILFHVVIASLQEIGWVIRPVQGQMQNLLLGLVFAEASLFYSLAGLFRSRSVNAYFAAAAACGALWQFFGYFDVPGHYHTMLYAVLGVAALASARSLGLESFVAYREGGQKALATRGRGLTAFQSGNAILSIALLSAFWQGLARLVSQNTGWIENTILLLTTAISIAAVCLVPRGSWRRIYTTASVLLGGLAILTISIDWLVTLTLGEKMELVCVVIGVALLIAGYVGRFRETDAEPHEMVGTGLFLGSTLATLPLLIAVAHHRWWGAGISLHDELGLLTVTVLMLVTGYGWQAKWPTLLGGGCLTLYLFLLIAELAHGAEKILGVAIFMTIVGTLIFAGGILLSVYRERLLELPEKIAKREGIFRIVTWR